MMAGAKTIPLNIVGSSAFGRYEKISAEKTFNMIISDDWLVDAAGYKKVASIITLGAGRGSHTSKILGSMIAVINNGVYKIDTDLNYSLISTISTSTGDVFIAENNAGQIAICDKSSIYIFNYLTNSFSKATLDFLPGYVEFQNGYFISPDLNSSKWRLSAPNNGLSWPTINTALFQSEPDRPVAVIKVPGKSNLLFVMGSRVTEIWYDAGLQLFPYQKNTVDSIDYGCINPATIAENEKIVVWVGVNAESGPAIMYSTGGNPQQISTDGINFQFARLTNPTNCFGFLFKQDGHLIYQLTFPDDRLTLAYDFNTSKFFHFSDPYMGPHIAKNVSFFNNAYYFISYADGNLYELSSNFTTFDGSEIPRVRVTETVRMPGGDRRVIQYLTFPLEQGEAKDIMAIDLSLSKNGGKSFGSAVRKQLNKPGVRPNKTQFRNLGSANELTLQLRFWGLGRFVVGNGELTLYQ